MAGECVGKYDEHSDFKSSILVVRWMCGFIISFLLIIIAGMSYAVSQNHRVDIKLVLLQDTVQDNGVAFITARRDHDDGLLLLRSQLTDLAAVCCEQ